MFSILSFYNITELEACCFVNHDHVPKVVELEEVNLDDVIEVGDASGAQLWSIWKSDVLPT